MNKKKIIKEFTQAEYESKLQQTIKIMDQAIKRSQLRASKLKQIIESKK